MEFKQIKELMAAMERAGLKKLSVKEKDGFELTLEKADEVHPHTQSHPSFHPVYHPPVIHMKETHAPQISSKSSAEQEKKEEKVEGRYVTSPMVGTFYSSPSPDDPIFVKVGDRVEENTVLCIIEAMKVMNEVKSGVSGVVAEICVSNGHPVEFGTKMFRIV